MREKLTRADAKLQNLPEEALADLWRFRHPEQGGEPMTLEAICVEIPKLYGFSVALSTLSGFYTWLTVKRRLDARASLADQLKLELARNPEVSEEQIRKAGQRLFMAEGILEKDAKVFAEMVKIGQNETRLKQNDQKIGLQKQVVQMDERKLAILEKKAAQADAANTVTHDAALTAEEKAARLKQIFRMG